MNPISEIPRLFERQADFLYNRDVWVLLNWEVREETEEVFSVWRRDLSPDPGMALGRLRLRAECRTLGAAFHYVETHLKERD